MKNVNKNIFLIGPLGAGKSSIGRYLAHLLKIDFFDSDEEIKIRSGVPIGWIFEAESESGFRRREMEVIALLVKKHPIVLSTGGGTITTAENCELLKTHGNVVYLDVSLEEQLRRTKRTDTRPILETTTDVRQKLIELNEARRPLYASIADFTYQTDNASPREVAAQILADITKKSL